MAMKLRVVSLAIFSLTIISTRWKFVICLIQRSNTVMSLLTLALGESCRKINWAPRWKREWSQPAAEYY